MGFKDVVRSGLNFLHLDLTKNLQYDRLTKAIMKKHFQSSWNALDVGCHKGEILDLILKLAPNGNHIGIEPIPEFYEKLNTKYSSNKVVIHECALSDESGKATFNFVKNAPAYSGLNQRKYDIDDPIIEEIHVQLKTIDEIYGPSAVLDFVKIDVEGGEFGVLKGGIETLKRNKPLIIFESGLGASDYYGVTPQEIYEFIEKELEQEIFTLRGFLKGYGGISLEEFVGYYNKGVEYYFVAW